MSKRHIEAIANYPAPKTVRQVQSFLGLANYFRKFIKDFLLKAYPLHQLTRKNVEFMWDDKAAEAFLQLKKELTSFPVLRLYNYNAETELHTDASALGFGAVLLQRQENKALAPIAYFSQATS